jgi:hypothetical protein
MNAFELSQHIDRPASLNPCLGNRTISEASDPE